MQNFFSWYELVYKTELGRVCLFGLFSKAELDFSSFEFPQKRAEAEFFENPETYSTPNKHIRRLRYLWACIDSPNEEGFLLGIELVLLYREIDATFNKLVEKKKSGTLLSEKEEWVKDLNFYRKELLQIFLTRELIVSAYKKVPVAFPNQKGAFLRAILKIDQVIYKMVKRLENCRYLFFTL